MTISGDVEAGLEDVPSRTTWSNALITSHRWLRGAWGVASPRRDVGQDTQGSADLVPKSHVKYLTNNCYVCYRLKQDFGLHKKHSEVRLAGVFLLF